MSKSGARFVRNCVARLSVRLPPPALRLTWVLHPHPLGTNPPQELLDPRVAGLTRNQPAVLETERARNDGPIFAGIAAQDTGHDDGGRHRHQPAAPDGEGPLCAIEEVAQAR